MIRDKAREIAPTNPVSGDWLKFRLAAKVAGQVKPRRKAIVSIVVDGNSVETIVVPHLDEAI